MPCQEQPQARVSLLLTPKVPPAVPGSTKSRLAIFSGFIVNSPAHPRSLWSRAVTLMSTSSVEQGCFLLPCVGGECRASLQGWPCPWPPGWEQGWEFYCFFHGERSFCQPLQQYQGVSSPTGDNLVLCTAVPMGRDVTHPLATPTWVPPASGARWLKQLQHCSPAACNSEPDHWQPDYQAPSGTSKGIQLPGSQESLSASGVP